MATNPEFLTSLIAIRHNQEMPLKNLEREKNGNHAMAPHKQEDFSSGVIGVYNLRWQPIVVGLKHMAFMIQFIILASAPVPKQH